MEAVVAVVPVVEVVGLPPTEELVGVVAVVVPPVTEVVGVVVVDVGVVVRVVGVAATAVDVGSLVSTTA